MIDIVEEAKECWLPVAGYEGLYEVSDAGNVRSLFRYKRLLKHNISKHGYHSVQLFKNKVGRRLLVHRLVATAFLPNPYGLPQINHKDEDKNNNAAKNLEWCTARYNMNYGIGAKARHTQINYSTQERKDQARKNGACHRKAVNQFDLNGLFLRTHDSVTDAAKASSISSPSAISACCAGSRKTAGGYTWKYREER